MCKNSLLEVEKMRSVKKKTMGFVISHKENEHRRALLPKDIKIIQNPTQLFFEKNYGNVLNIADEEYLALGCQIVSREVALQQDIICEPKIGDAEFLQNLLPGQLIFGWVHAVQNRDITDLLIEQKSSAYAWEKMYYMNRHSYWRNNELAGESGIVHAYLLNGRMPYDTKVAILGRGSTAQGANRILTKLGADVCIYNRNQEALFKKELGDYDVIVNAILWDTTRHDHIIYEKDLKRMRKGAMIIDISCDEHGAIETTSPTTFEDPTYYVDGILHYAVDHTPSIFYQTATAAISEETSKYIDDLIEGNPNPILRDALIIEDGKIMDQDINKFQDR